MAANQGQHQQHHLLNGRANGYSHQYAAGNNGMANDEFSTFFNVPGEDAAAASQKAASSQAWTAAQSNSIDTRLQQNSNAFNPTSQSHAWNGDTYQQDTHTGQGLGANDLSAAFRTNATPYNAGSGALFDAGNPYSSMYYGQPQQHQEYNPTNYAAPQQFYNNYPATIQPQAVSGQTISPSALQGFQSHGAQIRRSPSVQTNTSYYGNSINTQPSLRIYHDTLAEQLVSTLPASSAKGDGRARDGEAIKKATNSTGIGDYLFMGQEVFESEPVNGLNGKIETRESLNGMKRKVQQIQGKTPWEDVQLTWTKKMRFTRGTTKPMKLTSGSTAQVELASSGDDSSSTEDSEYESDAEVDEPSPLPAVRSSDPIKAISYDIIKILWYKRSRHLGGPTIRIAMKLYWDLVGPIRNNWKDAVTLQTQAKDGDKVAFARHKATATRYREQMDAALQATIKYGHRDIVEKLAEISNLLLSFYQMLADRYREEDCSGSIVISILNLVAAGTSITTGLLETSKLAKVLPRFEKLGNQVVKDLISKIDATVKANKDRPVSRISAVDEDVKMVTVKSEKTAAPRPAGSATSMSRVSSATKSSSTQGTKTAASKSSAPLSKTNGISKTTTIKTEKKPDVKAEATKAKQAPIATAPKYAGLMSASKKPKTADTAQNSDAKSAKPAEVKKPVVVTPAPAPTKSFSIFDTIASLGENKEAVAKKKAEDVKPKETDEERVKRERKASRKSLRVHWKPDALLVDTRIFEHDPEEDNRHDSNMLRDAADSKNEGQMLKLHKEMSVDDEDDLPEEQELLPWHETSRIDFSDLPEEALNDNYQSFGGAKEVTSTEKTVQEQRERSSMIAVYTSRSDIPPCPKEPYDPYSGPKQEEVQFGWSEEGKFPEIRRREAAYYAKQKPYQPPQSTPDISALLQILQQGQQQQPQQGFAPIPPPGFPGFPGFAQAAPPPPPPPVPAQQPAISGTLEALLAQYQKPVQSQAPPIGFPPPPSVIPPPPVDAATLAALGIHTIPQNGTPQPAYQPPSVAAAPVVPPPMTDLSSLLASITQNQQQQGQASVYNGDTNNKRRHDGDHNGDYRRGKMTKKNKGRH